MKTLQRRSAEAMGSFLNEQREWKVFATFTTEYTLSKNSARRLIERLHNTVKSKLQDPQLTTFWVAESNSAGFLNQYHLHALINATTESEHLIPTIQDSWARVSRSKRSQAYNRNKLEAFDKTKGAGYYLTKSLFTEEGEYDIIL